MKPLRIAMLGGTGFVGSHLVPRLVTDGHLVDVLSRNKARHPDLLVVPRSRVIDTDIGSVDALALRLAGCDAVVDLIGILNEKGDDGRGFHRVHVETTQRLIEACRRVGVRRVLMMSALNAGRGRSHYLRSRGEAEAALKSSGLDWTIFQPSVIFGRGDGLFYRFARLLAFAPVLPLARARAKFAPVYVGDVAEAYARALVDRSTIGQTYELYGPQTMTLKQIVAYTARITDRRRLIVPLPDAIGRVQAAVFDHVPGKPFSSDNFRSLQMDSVGGVDGLTRLGIEKTPVDAVMPELLRRSARQRRLDDDRARASRDTY